MVKMSSVDTLERVPLGDMHGKVNENSRVIKAFWF
jgi:hypothetical protein